jgi:hypothetical protein
MPDGDEHITHQRIHDSYRNPLASVRCADRSREPRKCPALSPRLSLALLARRIGTRSFHRSKAESEPEPAGSPHARRRTVDIESAVIGVDQPRSRRTRSSQRALPRRRGAAWRFVGVVREFSGHAARRESCPAPTSRSSGAPTYSCRCREGRTTLQCHRTATKRISGAESGGAGI